MSPQEMGSVKSFSSCQKGRLWTPQTGSKRQQARQELTRTEYCMKASVKAHRACPHCKVQANFSSQYTGTRCPQVLATDKPCVSSELSALAQTLLSVRRPQQEHKSCNLLAATAPGSIVADKIWSWTDMFILGISSPHAFCFSSDADTEGKKASTVWYFLAPLQISWTNRQT